MSISGLDFRTGSSYIASEGEWSRNEDGTMKPSLRLYLTLLLLIIPTLCLAQGNDSDRAGPSFVKADQILLPDCLAQEKDSHSTGPSSVKADQILLPQDRGGPKFLDAADCTCPACNDPGCCPGANPVPGVVCSCSDQHYECGNSKPIVCCQ